MKFKKDKNITGQKTLYFAYGETILKLKAKNEIKESAVSHVVPLSYNDQVPIFFEVIKDTSPKVKSYKVVDDRNPPNKIIKFIISPLEKDETITIHFKYHILIKNHTYNDISKNVQIPKSSEIPESEKKWLASTESIQSDNFLIKMTAWFVKGFNNNLLDLSKKIAYYICYRKPALSYIRFQIERYTFLRNIFLPSRYFTGLRDAVSALLFGGLCISRANFGVALYRANGVPARVLIANPIYFRLSEIKWLDALHSIMEFYIPNYGWVRSDSGSSPHQPKNDIILRICYPEDENVAGNGLSYYGGMVPWFSFSDKNIVLDFPGDIFKLYKKPKGEGFPITSKSIINRFKIDEERANSAFNLTKEAWSSYLKIFGKKLNEKDTIFFNQSIEMFKRSLEDLGKSNIDNYIKNIEKAECFLKNIK